MRARIYQPPKNAMQSGWAGTQEWVLEFEPGDGAQARPADGLDRQRRYPGAGVLRFDTREEAVAYAEKQVFRVRPGAAAKRAVQAQGLRRQFPLRTHGELDALMTKPLAVIASRRRSNPDARQ